jgi:hypothetical protein
MMGAKEFRLRNGFRAQDVEPGRAVPNDWDKHLVETWADRKARRAAERAAQAETAR